MEGDGSPQRDEVMISMGSLWIWGHCCSTHSCCGPTSICASRNQSTAVGFSSPASICRWAGAAVEGENEIMSFFREMFIHEAPIFLLALPGLSAGCGMHTPGWSSICHTKKWKHSSAGEEKNKQKKRLNDSFTSFNMAGNKLAYWWQWVMSEWCYRRVFCLWSDLGKMFSEKEVSWFHVLSWRNSLGWMKFSSHCSACKFQC